MKLLPRLGAAFAGAAALLAACGSPSSGLPADALYAEHCARCHGDDGRGDARQHKLAPNIDLTRSLMVARAARGMIYQRISRGYGSMPGFAHKLERGDIEALTTYILRFGTR